MPPTSPTTGNPPPRRRDPYGRAQLSLVEHALCPLDSSVSMQSGFVHSASYFFTDKSRNRKTAKARVICPDGLAASDEFYLWALLAVTFAQRDQGSDLFATPHYCLRQMGSIENRTDKGGKTYRLFREAVERLALVTYQNDHFYDPVRGEHRRVGFGFLSYSLPLDPRSSRAWRFAWDPIFFEFCQAAGSVLSFDLATYRQFDAATRRLYLLLKKIFWRDEVSPAFDLRHLAVNVLGFAATLPTWKLKQKLVPCIETLLDAGMLRLPMTAKRPADLFTKLSAGEYRLEFHRGADFDRHTGATPTADVRDSPFYDQLHGIGFDLPTIRWILAAFKPRLIAEWSDITLAAKERNGESFFTASPQAYFIDNIKAAAAGVRTPPDWWRELRKQEEQKRRQRETPPELDHAAIADRAFEEFIQTEAKDSFDRIMHRVFTDLVSKGQAEHAARENAAYVARMNLRAKFRAAHPQFPG